MPVLWALWGIAVLNVAAVFVSFTVHVIGSRFTTAGPPLLTILLIISAMATTFAGGLSGLLLILLSRLGSPMRVVLIVSTVALLTGAASVVALFAGQARLSRRARRIGGQLLSADEVVALIEAGLVRSFSRREGVLELSLDPRVDEDPELWTRRAHPQDYPTFVAAADELLAEGRMIHYDDETGEGPSSTTHRWITLEEATALLGADKVTTFSYGSRGGSGDTRATFRGTPTGIRLTDHGWVRHIQVAPAMEAILVPLARVAQASHGRPQFHVNGCSER